MDEATVEAIRDRACIGKDKLGPVRARNLAQNAQLRGDDLHPYRCPFCGSWHLGHPPSWEGVEQLAEAIRFLAYPDTIDRRAS